jgi:flavin reductase (DIM6/NTAB) family NADH-FMN oxidoreductase RutF
MRSAVTGVNLVTTDGTAGRHGLTVASMASVSADPEMLLVCIARRSPLLPAIREHGAFAVNALGAHQADLADRFAGRPFEGESYDFGAATWEPGATGSPLLIGAAARFDCLLASTVEAGSHTIVIGDVLAADRGAVPALAYSRREYSRPVPLRVKARSRRPTRTASDARSPRAGSR